MTVQRIFIVHRWGGSPSADWYPWMKQQLEERDFAVTVPLLPHPEAPEISLWVSAVRKAVGTPDINTFFVGHSVGCQTILRYLESLPKNVKVGGAVFVAGWFVLTQESTPTEKEQVIAKPWLEEKINFEKVREHTTNFVALLSDNDPYVPLRENQFKFETLGARVVVEHNQGHYDEDTSTHTLEKGLHLVLEMVRHYRKGN